MLSILEWVRRRWAVAYASFVLLMLVLNILYHFWLHALFRVTVRTKVDHLVWELSIIGVAVPLIIASAICLHYRFGAGLSAYPHQKSLRFLLIIDVLFVLLHLSRAQLGWPAQSEFNIDIDWGYAEIFQYAKEFAIAALLMLTALKHRRLALVLWSSFFAFLLLDDSLQLHERLGTRIGRLVDSELSLGLDRQVVGEVIASIGFGCVFLVPVILFVVAGHRKVISDRANGPLFFLTICLVFFGVAVDAIKNYLPTLGLVFDVIEDGGEMVVMSVVVWAAYNVYRLSPMKGFSERHRPV